MRTAKDISGIVVIAGLCIALFISVDRCNKNRKDADTNAGLATALQAKVSNWKDKYGTEHAEKLALVGNVKQLKAANIHLIDTVAKLLKVKPKHIRNISAGSIETSREVITKIDTLFLTADSTKQAYSFTYQDKWLDLKGEIEQEQIRMRYRSFDSVVFTTYEKKRKGFLNFHRDVYVDGYSTNPHSRVKGITGIKVSEEKRKRFGAGPYIGYGFDGQQMRLTIGVSVNYDVIQF